MSQKRVNKERVDESYAVIGGFAILCGFIGFGILGSKIAQVAFERDIDEYRDSIAKNINVNAKSDVYTKGFSDGAYSTLNVWRNRQRPTNIESILDSIVSKHIESLKQFKDSIANENIRNGEHTR